MDEGSARLDQLRDLSQQSFPHPGAGYVMQNSKGENSIERSKREIPPPVFLHQIDPFKSNPYFRRRNMSSKRCLSFLQ
jgi:hypothetical protein